MRAILTSSIVLGFIACALVSGMAKVHAQAPASPPVEIDNYEAGPDSKPQPGVPRGKTFFEFDGLNDSLARCIVEEIFPAVEKRRTPDGRPIKLSRDPNDRCAGGASTGGVAAFTLAWERPDLFRRVFSAIGTFVGMRGGDRYPVLVRKTEPKPIRVFQQDGENDQWLGGPEVGDWWMSNQTKGASVRPQWPLPRYPSFTGQRSDQRLLRRHEV